MSRRGNRSRRDVHVPSRLQTFSSLFRSTDLWFDADSFTQSGGNTVDLVNRFDATKTLTQATAGTRCAAPAAHADFGGKLCLTFTGAQWYASNQAASAFVKLHNGTGCEIIHVLTPTSTATATVSCTYNYDAANNDGHVVYLQSAAPTASFAVAKTGAAVLSASGAVAASGTPTWINAFYDEALASGQRRGVGVKGVISGLGDSVAAADPGNPQGTFRLGASTTPALFLAARWRATYLFMRSLTASERAIVKQFIAWDTGIV